MKWLKPDTTRKMSETDAAWLAGFFDGEGSVGSWPRKNRKDGSFFPSYYLKIPNTFRAALEKCQQITSVGNINEKPYQPLNPTYKPQWAWCVYGQRNIVNLLDQMLPFLTVKQEKAQEMLSQIKVHS